MDSEHQKEQIKPGGLHPPEHYQRDLGPYEPVDIGARVDEHHKAKQAYAGYEQLQAVLMDALDQAAHAKGQERHAKGQPFHEQRMQSISHLIGTERGMAFQVIKKLTEGMDLPDPDARERELLGAINYLAGMVVYFRNQEEPS